MDKFVRFCAPTSKIDFCLKFIVCLLICGALNHLRHVLTHGFPVEKSFWTCLFEASFTAVPMSWIALLIMGHLHYLQKRLYVQAARDQLTGLPNRRWFMEKTPDELGANQALMIIDIDHFKTINDQYGHDAGDRCLQQMAQHLRNILGELPLYARIGGEEFAVFWPQADDVAVRRAARKISIGFLFQVTEDDRKQITSSVGISFNPLGQSRAEAIKLADRATYKAKSDGRACYVITDEAA